MRPGREAAITGLGAVSALGQGAEALWSAIETGADGIGPISRFPTSEFSVRLGAMVPGHDGCSLRDDYDASSSLCLDFALTAAREAFEQARVADCGLAPERIGLVLGTSLGARDGVLHELAEELADSLGARGPRLTVSTACSSSTGALGLACDLLRGSAGMVIAGGTDVLVPEVFAGFHALGVLSEGKCAPFSQPVGTTLGEGSGFLVLETVDQAVSRGVRPIATLLGYGLSGDAYHETSPDPSGKGLARAIAGAMQDAGIEASAVGYINAHGSGTAANDPAEWRALQSVFGEYSSTLPVSSVKSYLGHAQGAAGVLEAIVTILAMKRGVVPPTLHFKSPRPLCMEDPVGDLRPRKTRYSHAVSVSSAFGGANAAVVLAKPGASRRHEEPRPIWILGAGAVGPHGLGLESLSASLEGGGSKAGHVPAFEIDSILPTADPRGMDPATAYLTAAAAMSLQDAGVVVRRDLRERAGLIVGTTHLSPSSTQALQDSIDERGLSGLSAKAFARIVLNAPAGSCSKLLSLKGPNTTLTTGQGSGLTAVLCAAEMLSTRGDVELIVAGGVDEISDGGAPFDAAGAGVPGESEGSACVVLSNDAGRARASGATAACVAGWGLAGPGRLSEAVAQALARAGISADSVQAVCGAEIPQTLAVLSSDAPDELLAIDPVRALGLAEAASAALACVAAMLVLRERRAKVALVTSEAGRSVSSAVVLVAGGPDEA